MARKIRTLIVDDSVFMRRSIKRMLRSDAEIEVIAEARDGAEAVAKVLALRPDVVTMDVNMPDCNGLQALETIMRDCPTPVLMVSSLTSEGGQVTLQALEMGAVDFIDKSSCHTMLDILDIADALIQKIKVLAGVDLSKVEVSRHRRLEPPALPPPIADASAELISPSALIALGTSTGGPMSIERVLTQLPADLPAAILMVQHMPVGFTASLAQRLDRLCALSVKEAEQHEPVMPGTVYLAPGGCHLRIANGHGLCQVELGKSPLTEPHRPSVDVLLESVADVWKGPMMAIVMTGMGADGARGVKAVKQAGGLVIAQDRDTCVVYGMPKAAYDTGCVDRLVPLDQIPDHINGFLAAGRALNGN
jgi:two-component system, chemotaxis family, protein-glutamate methylesterase/glutaminase